MINDLKPVGTEVSITVSSSLLHFRGVETVISNASLGVVITEVSGVRLSSCPYKILVVVRDTSVVLAAGSSVFLGDQKVENSASQLTFLASLLSQHTLLPLLLASAQYLQPFLTVLVSSAQLPFVAKKELSNSNVYLTQRNTIELRWDGDSRSAGATSSHSFDLVDRCNRTACIFNVSAVFLPTYITGNTVIEVDDVAFRAIPPTSPDLSEDNGRLYFSVFSVTVELVATLSGTTTLMAKNFVLDCPLRTTPTAGWFECVVVPISANGVVLASSLVSTMSSVILFKGGSSLVFVGSVLNDSTTSKGALSIVQNFGFLSTRMPQNANSTSAIQFLDNATVVIQASHFFSAAPVQQLFGRDSQSIVGTWSDSSKLVLGCNQWNGKPFPSKSTPSWGMLNGVPRRARLFNSSVLMGDSAPPFFNNCSAPLEGLYSLSRSSSQTPTYVAKELQAAAVTLPSFSPNTALLSLASLDSVTLIAVGQSVCASAELKQSTSDTRYLLSPFYDYGGEASTLGNVGLLVGFGVFHFLCAQFLLNGKIADRKSEPPRHSSMSQEQQQYQQQQHDLASPKLNSLVRRSRRAWWPSNGFVTAHFPNVTIDAAVFVVNGTIFTAVNSITQGTTTRLRSDGLSVLAGVVGLMFTLALIGMLVVVERRNVKSKSRRPSAGEEKRNVPFLLNFYFDEYSHKVRYSSRWIPAFLLPYGRWEPLEMRSSIGKLRSLCRVGDSCLSAAVPCHRFAMMPSVVSVIIHCVLGVQSATSWWCPLQWTVLSLLTATCAVGIGLAQPARIPVVNVILVIQYILQTLVFVFSAVVQNSSNDDSSWAATTLMAIATLSTIVSIAKLIHNVMIVLWERNRATTEAEKEEAAAVTAPTLSSMFSKGPDLPVMMSSSSLRPLDELFLSSEPASHRFHVDAVKVRHSNNVGGTTSSSPYYQRQHIKDHNKEPDEKRPELSLRRMSSSPLSSSLSRCRIPSLVHSSAMADVEGDLLFRHDGSRDDSDVRNQRQSQHAATIFAQFLLQSSARTQQQSGAMGGAEQIVALEQVIQFIVKSKQIDGGKK
ncbi:transmembrane protein, putative [Bodo saltans]|uniref:Transmembrane protein, putative n=1 Tax=Bodo saltans TaxID=75058 RepID=A0A0S4IXX2_BODSA|nr:transmembrane protein, putative [Bodo saltans]CUG07032.1 transmembrane protein, putative [Bodo saltans]|eukprot:CUG07019.1 transmembrane protein, putative [Bodo saltans]